MSVYNHLIPADLSTGTLTISPQPNRFAYLKIPDRVVHALFEKFKGLCSDPDIQLSPYFEPSDRYPNPVGAHITIVNSGVFSQITADPLFDFQGSTFPFKCTKIEEKTPTYWKQMEKVWICAVESRALDRINKMLCRDLAEGESFHFTFAVKPKTEAIEPIARQLPTVETISERALDNFRYDNQADLLNRLNAFTERGRFIDENPSNDRISLPHEFGHVYQSGSDKDDILLFHHFFGYSFDHLQGTIPKRVFSEEYITDCLFSETSELNAADILKDADPSLITAEHIYFAGMRGFKHVANMLVRKAKSTLNDTINHEQLDVSPISRVNNYSGFAYDEVEGIINEVDNEIEAIQVLFDYDDLIFKARHINIALDYGYRKLAEMIENYLEDQVQPEEESDDFISSDLDDIEVPLRRRKIKIEDPVSSIIRNRFDDNGVLRKIRRLSKVKFEVNHVMLARKQDLPETEKYLRKALI